MLDPLEQRPERQRHPVRDRDRTEIWGALNAVGIRTGHGDFSIQIDCDFMALSSCQFYEIFATACVAAEIRAY
ncbi:hypothetical protein LRS73_14575 [Methylobacterium currus]|uniref:hypothetical protein n=1 Tax=Methylobacterium currus TaxID=2051553 RepID=UPI001E55B8DF|nr:hypothetical protein [Methylobacterium currus]UHC13818.1 hypothetical protein LRS73_14575 [Methylobacterium currus]